MRALLKDEGSSKNCFAGCSAHSASRFASHANTYRTPYAIIMVCRTVGIAESAHLRILRLSRFEIYLYTVSIRCVWMWGGFGRG